MPEVPTYVKTSAPGRICLFGEHQDYLGLPVIAMAVNLRISLTGKRSDSPFWKISLPDIHKEFCFDPNKAFEYRHERDYLPAAANVLRRDFGVLWPYSFELTVSGNVPINSGTSSSSALQVAWSAFLLAAAGDPRAFDPSFVAKIANLSEVCEFGSPGGVMDHVSSAHGGLVWIDTRQPVKVQKLGAAPSPFILIDSGIAKDTNGVLGSRRELAEAGLSYLKNKYTDKTNDVWDLAKSEDVAAVESEFGLEAATVMRGNMENRIFCAAAKEILQRNTPDTDSALIGSLLNAHHASLSRCIGVSHPFIDEVLNDARELGALGGKINGSGCGGAFYTLTAQKPRLISQMLNRKGLRHWEIQAGEGVRIELGE